MPSMTVRPAVEEVLAHPGEETHIAVCAEIPVPTETPLSLFQRLAGDRPGAFLLESAAGDELMGRYSFFGYDVGDSLTLQGGTVTMRMGGVTTSRSDADLLTVLRETLRAYRVVPLQDAPRLQGGAVGYFGFNCVTEMERVPLATGEGVRVPDALLLLPTELCAYDHLTRRLTCIVHVPLAGDRRANYDRARRRLEALRDRLARPEAGAVDMEPVADEAPFPTPAEAIASLEITCSRERVEMEHAVLEARGAIERGEVFQVVLSQRLSTPCDLSPFDVYRALRDVSPAPYMFFLRFKEVSILGASPEMLVRLDGEELLLCPIAGTRPRSASREEDLALERELLADEKELAEHQMLVDLGRNDLARVAAAGSVRVDRATRVVRYSHVMHIVSDIRGRLAPGKDAVDVLRACFPAGTVSGAPKVRACELIARLEPDRRGVYAGAVGYLDLHGNLDTCIAIRTIVVSEGRASLQTGAGIVHDSVPSREVDECWNKARAGLVALAVARRRAQSRQRAAMTNKGGRGTGGDVGMAALGAGGAL